VFEAGMVLDNQTYVLPRNSSTRISPYDFPFFQFSRSVEATEAIKAVVSSVDLWTAYRIGRTATRYGHYNIGMKYFRM
jgi:hypothetical protein